MKQQTNQPYEQCYVETSIILPTTTNFFVSGAGKIESLLEIKVF